MKIKEIHNLAVKMGMESDFRSRDGVEKLLARKRAKHEKDLKKEDFDKESLENPYLDSGIHNVSKDVEVKKILAGIDIDSAELLLSKALGGIDLVMAHHPIGKSLAYLAEVMDLQCDVYNYYGVPINIAEGLMKEKISEVSRGVGSRNHQRVVDTARLLGINLVNYHTPPDNLAAKFLKDRIEEVEPERLEDLMELLKSIPEYQKAAKMGAGPKIFAGDKENHCGKIALTEITGGTSGSPKLYEKMAQFGIGSVVGMHIDEEGRKEAESANINVVIAGHMSSDSLGMNIFLDELEKQGIDIIPCSGLIRISRNS